MAWFGSPLFGAVGKQGWWSALEQHHWLKPPFTSATPLQSTVQAAPAPWLPHESSVSCPGQGFDPMMVGVGVPVVMGRLIGMAPVLEPSGGPGGHWCERLYVVLMPAAGLTTGTVPSTVQLLPLFGPPLQVAVEPRGPLPQRGQTSVAGVENTIELRRTGVGVESNVPIWMSTAPCTVEAAN